MYNKAIEILNIFNQHGYLAYIVGGYPRDTILGLTTKDIDICTNARPKDIMEIFSENNVTDCGYGAVKLIYKNKYFDVTTFRKDLKYENNRRPVKMRYVNDLKKDLKRRDFTVNTICIDKDGDYIDLLSAGDDLDKRIIKTVSNPRYKLKEDALRILRAIRFSCNLDFVIDKKTSKYIKKYGYLLKNLSYTRKKEELDKIFSSINKEKGREYILKYGLDKYLDLNNLDKIVLCDDLIGIWSQLKGIDNYSFNKLEKSQINDIRKMLNMEFDNYLVYKYGLYLSTVVGSIKGIKYSDVNKMYQELVITSKKDLVVSANDICSYLKRKPDKLLSTIISDIEKQVVNKQIENNKRSIYKYIGGKYGNI